MFFLLYLREPDFFPPLFILYRSDEGVQLAIFLSERMSSLYGAHFCLWITVWKAGGPVLHSALPCLSALVLACLFPLSLPVGT